MTLDAITASFELIYAKLSGDATLMALVTGVYQDGAPENAEPDYVTIGVQSSGTDTLTATAVRRLTLPLMRVLVSGPLDDMANLSAAYERIDALIGLIRNDPGGIIACYREEALYLPEPKLIAGKRWTSLGGLYRTEF